jgi:hypothetical protein
VRCTPQASRKSAHATTACSSNWLKLLCDPDLGSGITSEDGEVRFKLPLTPPSEFEIGFEGYFDATEPGRSGVAAALFTSVRPWTASSRRAWGGIIRAGTLPVSDRAHVLVLFLDCADAPAIGARIEAQPSARDTQTRTFYTSDGQVVFDEDSTVGSAAFVWGLIPDFGFVEIAAWDVNGAGLVGCERVPVRPGVITYAVLMSPLRAGDDLNCAWRR